MLAEEGIEIARITGGVCVKNLFFYAKREKSRYRLRQPGNKRLNFKTLETALFVRHLQFSSAGELRTLPGPHPCAMMCLGLVFDTASSVRVLVDKELTGLDRTDCQPRRNAASFAIALADILNGRIPAAEHADCRRAQPAPGLRLQRHQTFTSTPG